MIEQAIQDSTNDGYKSAFRQYLRFCHQIGITPLPLDEIKILFWLAHRTSEVKANSALTNYYGVKKLALYYGYPTEDTSWHWLKQAKTTIKEIFGTNTPDKRLPITFEMLEKMYPYFNMYNYEDLMMYTLMVCAATGLMRTSEICAKHKKVDPNKQDKASVMALWNRQLTPYRDEKTGLLTHYSCNIRATKNEKGKCAVDIVWAIGKWPVSPCELMTQYLHARMKIARKNTNLSLSPNAPLFQMLDGSICTIKDVQQRLNILIAAMKLDPLKYTIYSFRIGGATSLARRGVDHRMIQIAGRWRSEAYALYIRMTIKSMAVNQAHFLQADVVNRDVVFLHQNIPPNLLVKA